MSIALLVNGRSETRVDVADRGFQYGDGVFTTLPVRSARPIFLPLHLARLARDCARLQIPFPGESILEAEARQLCRRHAEGVLKIQITRGPGNRGYRPPAHAQATRVLGLQAGGAATPQWSERGARVRICHHRLGRNPALAGIKHMNRLEQILARAEWDSENVQEGLMLDSAGSLVDGTMSNVFIVHGARLVTPDLSQCGVAGVMRSVILAMAAAERLAVEVRPVAVGELATATEVFLTNSLIGIGPVVALDGRSWPIGPVTRRLSRRVAAQLRVELGEPEK